MAVIGYPLDDREYLAEDAAAFHCTRTDGVFSSDTDYIVTAPGGMRVTVSTGVAWLKAYEFGGMVAANREAETLDVEVADATFRRIDRVVIRFDKLLLSSYLAVKTGTPATNPVAPALTRDATAYELGICDITVNAGVLEITGGVLNDTRLNESLCGLMRDDVTRIPTQSLYDNWWNWFSELKLDAENQAQSFIEWMQYFIQENEAAFNEWYSNFKETIEAELDQWIATYKSAYSEAFLAWYNDFKDNSESEVQDLIDALRGMLDEGAEAALYKRINDHEQLKVISSEVHGLRYKDGWLQIEVSPGSWANLVSIKYGLRVRYINGLNMTVAQINMLAMTVEEINNATEREVG